MVGFQGIPDFMGLASRLYQSEAGDENPLLMGLQGLISKLPRGQRGGGSKIIDQFINIMQGNPIEPQQNYSIGQIQDNSQIQQMQLNRRPAATPSGGG